jgi:hypothetical protein
MIKILAESDKYQLGLTMDIKAKTMEKEHEELHAELRKATTAGGATGKTAKKPAGVLHHIL